ncbi:aldehyde dehydrogenase family protein [Mesorhizobium caraganae]|uniref:aldehyde dehydrogenase family protein n=1 Tax=Mesorhizobium caraganae TaxID=483206 RepID=UPI003F4F3F37
MLVVKQPVGVAASMVARRIPPVLAAGCAVILKPAEQTPLVVAGAMIALAAEAGFPEGVVNLIYACKGDAIGRS